MNKGVLTGVGVLVAIAAVGFFITRGSYKAPGEQVSVPGTTDVPEMVVAPQAGEREIAVEGDEYKFSPSTIELVAGERVKITFKNTGSLPHNLMIDELGVATKTVSGGKEDAVSFTAEKTGTFVFYCGVGDHRGLGMEGVVVVK